MDESVRKLQCLAESGVNLIAAPDVTTHFVFERGGFILLVERVGSGFGGIGSPGLLTDHGFTALLWRGADAFFVAKGFEERATEEQVAAAREFAQIVNRCLAA